MKIVFECKHRSNPVEATDIKTKKAQIHKACPDGEGLEAPL